VGSQGIVWAIEPVPRNVMRLQQLRDANELKTLRVFAGALSNRTGTVLVKTGRVLVKLPMSGNSNWASITKSWDSDRGVEVQAWRLDDLVQRERVDRPISLLKIDVEGFEPQVLEGAVNTLREMKPAVFCEFNDILLRDAGSSSGRLLAAFAELGYRPADGWVRQARKLTGRLVDLLLIAK
jgi:FkbM family methyltransferase